MGEGPGDENLENTVGKPNWFSLRFQNSEAEQAFYRGRRDKLANSFVPLLFLSTVLFVIFMLNRWLAWDQENEMVQVQMWCLAVLTTIFALMGLVAANKKATNFIGYRGAEVMVGILCLSTLVNFTVLTPGVLAHIDGNPTLAAYDVLGQNFAVARMLAAVDVVLVVSHLLLPTCWVHMAWLDLTCLICFTGCSRLVLGMYDWTYIGSIAFIIATLSGGGRSMERTERELFAKVASERTRRVMVEFLHEVNRGGSGAEESDTVSVARTTWTGEIFQKAAKSRVGFEALQTLGRKEQWLIEEDELRIQVSQVVGHGGCSVVQAGEFYRKSVAVKRHKQLPGRDSVKFAESICNELRIMRHVRHPNIVLFYGAVFLDEGIALVMERIKGIDLAQYRTKLQGWKRQSPHRREQICIAAGVCQALIYMHSRKPCLVHGDIKPSNVVIERRGREVFPKLLDFGLTCIVTRSAQLIGGTPIYMSPEIIRQPGSRPSPASDVFSLGMLMFYVASGRSPLHQYSAEQVAASVVRSGQVPRLEFKPRTWLLDQWEGGIENCVSMNSDERMSTQEIYDNLIERSRRAAEIGARRQATASELDDDSQGLEGSIGSLSLCASLSLGVRSMGMGEGEDERQDATLQL